MKPRPLSKAERSHLDAVSGVFFARLEEMGIIEDAKAIAACSGATLEEVISASRYAHVTRARFALMHFVRETFSWSYPAIGRLFDRDHSTVLSGIALHRERLAALRLRIAS